MMTRLNHSFEQIRQFSTDVSHELRTPLTVVRGQLEVALFTAQTVEQYREAMADALEGVDRLSNIVRALLMLSQAESGQLVLQKNRTRSCRAGCATWWISTRFPPKPRASDCRPICPRICMIHARSHSDRADGLESVGQRHQVHAGRRPRAVRLIRRRRSGEVDGGRYRRRHLARIICRTSSIASIAYPRPTRKRDSGWD